METREDSSDLDASLKMHPQMSMGAVSLRTKDLDAMLSFYVEDLGLEITRRADAGETVELGMRGESADPLLILRNEANAEKAPDNAAGLYHYAILLPDRKSLAAAYLSLGNAGVLFDGFADHLVSEALYLTDPEGNEMEIYADRPRDQWKHDEDGQVQMATQPLDLDALVKELPSGDIEDLTAIPEKTKIGHIHLKITYLNESVDFYRNLLGFDLMSHWGSAAFLSVGGYHHHLGLNTWESHGGPSSAEGRLGLEYFTISIPDRDLVQALTSRLKETSFFQSQDADQLLISDPDGIRILVKASTIE